MSKNLMKQ